MLSTIQFSMVCSVNWSLCCVALVLSLPEGEMKRGPMFSSPGLVTRLTRPGISYRYDFGVRLGLGERFPNLIPQSWFPEDRRKVKWRLCVLKECIIRYNCCVRDRWIRSLSPHSIFSLKVYRMAASQKCFMTTADAPISL
jgi:hypothetical protein